MTTEPKSLIPPADDVPDLVSTELDRLEAAWRAEDVAAGVVDTPLSARAQAALDAHMAAFDAQWAPKLAARDGELVAADKEDVP